MPELPEVEVTRQTMADRVVGGRVLDVRMGLPLRWPLGIEPSELVGRTAQDVGRRGKYLLLHLDQGLLLLHLGMSGSLSVRENPPAPGAHDHFDLTTTRGVLRLHDPRRFGAVLWSPSLDADPARKLLAKLGAEPLGDDFTADAFYAALQRRSTPIKQVLMAGEVVVGVGNIYASEVLFKAGIRPTTRANKLSRPRANSLHAAIRSVLHRAVERGGTTFRNFSNALGETGHFQVEAAVYAREGLPCRVCGTPIRQVRMGQRSTFYCPTCQKP